MINNDGYRITGPYGISTGNPGPLLYVRTPQNLKDLAECIAVDVKGFGGPDVTDGATYRATKYRNGEPVSEEIEYKVVLGRPRRV